MMRRVGGFLIWAMALNLIMGARCAIADSTTEPEVVVFEYRGKLYYLDDIDTFIKQNGDDVCVSSIGGVDTLYTRLLSACRDSILSSASKTENWAHRIKMKLMSNKDALKYCLLEKSRLKNKSINYDVAYKITQNLNACIARVGVHADVGSCPLGGLFVRSETDLENIRDLARYIGNTYHFEKSIENPLIGIFNGRTMIVCDGGRPVDIVQPSFSGREQCQGGVFESLPGHGGTPDGVYLARNSDIDVISGAGSQASWGQYRIPLLPARETNTFDRTNMYLHGTTDRCKRRSGGCVSMGVAIEDFVKRNFIQNRRDMIIIIEKVPSIDFQNEYKNLDAACVVENKMTDAVLSHFSGVQTETPDEASVMAQQYLQSDIKMCDSYDDNNVVCLVPDCDARPGTQDYVTCHCRASSDMYKMEFDDVCD